MKPLLFSLIVLFSYSLSAQELTAEERASIEKLVLADIPDGGPGAAVGIIRNGEVIYERYAGLADLKGKRPITELTRFNLASNAKQFTSVRALQLIDAGKLSLGDDIRRYLPELFPELKTPITIKQLINHTSGIRDVYDLWSVQGFTWWKKDFTNDDALTLLVRQRELNFQPGSKHLYSNSNYIVLAHIIARVTGRSFKADTDVFFSKLGMPNTSFRDEQNPPVPDLARPYFSFKTWTTYKLPTTLHGDGGLFGNLRDQLTWETAVQTRESPAISGKLLRLSQLPLDTVTDYAYGLENDTYRDVPIRYHDGSTGAWKASTLRFPEERLSIVVLNNSGKFGTNYLARQIADVLLFKDISQNNYPLGPTVIGERIPEAELLGTYLINNINYYHFVSRNGTLFLERSNRNPVAVEWETGNVYHEIKDPAFKQVFTRDSAGRLEVTAYYPQHDPYTLTKMDDNWTDYDFAGITGDYYNEELDVTASLKYKEGKEFTVKVNKQKADVGMILPGVLFFQGTPLRMVRDTEGKVRAINYTDGRIENLRFVRQ